jgi:hypothetical protein
LGLVILGIIPTVLWQRQSIKGGTCYSLDNEPVIQMLGQSAVVSTKMFDRASQPSGFINGNDEVQLYAVCVKNDSEDYQVHVIGSNLSGYVPAYPPFPQYPVPGAKISTQLGSGTEVYYKDSQGEIQSTMLGSGEEVRVIGPDDQGYYRIHVLSSNLDAWLPEALLAPGSIALGDISGAQAKENAPLRVLWLLTVYFRLFPGHIRGAEVIGRRRIRRSARRA